MISILTYHQVAEIPPSLDPVGLAVAPAQFEQQMSYLAHKGYQCLSLGEAVEHIRARKDAPARSFTTPPISSRCSTPNASRATA